MKTLVVFVLAALGWSLAEGKHVQKCDLMKQLKTAACDPQRKEMLDVPNVDDLVAKIVCKAEATTGFDTCAMKEMRSAQEHCRGKSGHNTPKGRRQRSLLKPPPQNPPSQHHCTLYGVFQMASHLVCDDGVTPSANMCGMPCSDLHDDNIADDVECLLNVTSSLGDSFFGVKTWKVEGGQMKHVTEEKCANIQASTYFKSCPKP